ncbi:MAG TPA: putative quinol monooxygenase [Candidatus Saccharimonadia bacterium]|nr:putative quinol monooxygenase [Candidatus Saccharimonadia bacterium]
MKLFLILALTIMTTLLGGDATAADMDQRVIRVARLQIHAGQLEAYKAALKEEIETSVRVEPGVLSLYAVSHKDQPTHVTVFEIYASQAAYEAHLQAPHFKKYKTTTQSMIQSLELAETTPIALSAKKE